MQMAVVIVRGRGEKILTTRFLSFLHTKIISSILTKVNLQ